MRKRSGASVRAEIIGGRKRWRLRYTDSDGKDRSERYSKKSDATNRQTQLNADRDIPLSAIPVGQQLEAVMAIRVASEHGFSLLDAANQYLKLRPKTETCSIGKAVDEFIETQARKKLRPRTIGSYRASLKAFTFGIEDSIVTDVSRGDIEAYISGQSWGELRARRFITEIGTFFTYCVKSGYCSTNPADSIEKPKIEHADVEPLTVEQCGRLLKATVEHAPKTLAHVAIAMFAGVRSQEILRISWDRIDMDEDMIDMNIKATKKRRRRLIDIHPTLKLWLIEAKQRGARLPYPKIYQVWKLPISKAGIKNWSGSQLRKTCVSYHVGHFKNLSLATDQFGHSEAVLHEHYRGVVKRSEAAKFWGLTPERVLRD